MGPSSSFPSCFLPVVATNSKEEDSEEKCEAERPWTLYGRPHILDMCSVVTKGTKKLFRGDNSKQLIYCLFICVRKLANAKCHHSMLTLTRILLDDVSHKTHPGKELLSF